LGRRGGVEEGVAKVAKVAKMAWQSLSPRVTECGEDTIPLE
jgi:hypothetical protein